MSLRIHHIALTAEDLLTSGKFYDALLGLCGYQRHHTSDRVISWVPPKTSHESPELLLYAAKEGQKENRHMLYEPGAHHFCFAVEAKELVDRIAARAAGGGGDVLDPPKDYPSYAKNVGSDRYYAVFVNDPSSIKLEFAWMPRAD